MEKRSCSRPAKLKEIFDRPLYELKTTPRKTAAASKHLNVKTPPRKKKGELAAELRLTHYDPKKPLCFVCGASLRGVGSNDPYVLPNVGKSARSSRTSSTLSPSGRKTDRSSKRHLVLCFWGKKKKSQLTPAGKYSPLLRNKILRSEFKKKKPNSNPQFSRTTIERWVPSLLLCNDI